MERKLKVYLAAPFQWKDQIKKYASELRDLGIEVTSSWLDEPNKPDIQMHELTHEDHQKYAMKDVLDVRSSDVLVLFTVPEKNIIRAGRHVEFGIAVGINLTRCMPIYVVGIEYENIFHTLPSVTHFDSWSGAKSALDFLSTTAFKISE